VRGELKSCFYGMSYFYNKMKYWAKNSLSFLF
jgi:hypothetical protein